MKTLKTLLTVFAMAGIFSAGALAQTPTNQTVQASAEIISNLSAGATSALSFGQILASATPSIAYNTASAGWAEFTGATEGATMDVAITYPASLTTTGTSGTALTFAADAGAGYQSTSGTADPTSATALASATSGSFTATSDGTNTDFFIFVGGSITDASAGVSGETYTGDITIAVTHQ
ncbi:MAG: hypothetical protein HUJ22_02850 [Gracilimonas sp.]|uniref:hypothetical protein n=1 Tax=Gracilimonas sp. TaxID=1974203 RepID=UPI0019AF5152|nr:hypothetical protein [Gracilimonas sp.]MBD3615484.1 hypothetical protein [Gracilimonas sp.]